MRDNESLIDISDSIRLILQYTQGIDFDRFTQNEEKQDAVLRRLIIIGEATKRLSPEFRSQHPTIPWRNIAGLRDIAVHEY
ncbi:MAG: HepT-like ribonuclease domain-containing protein [Geitlerinemataceae cyanobacterium]